MRAPRTSPLRNRVTPLGELVADPARGLVHGNRGCLHDGQGAIRRPYAVRRWIACRLQYRGWQRGPMMRPGRFTELFFLDDATALAAGHRPCALCRRRDYNWLVAIWRDLHGGEPGADAIDLQLHRERWDGGGRRLHQVPPGELPDGSFLLYEGVPWLVYRDSMLRFTPAGYTERRSLAPRPRARLITPPSLMALLAAGWQPLVPLVHPSAEAGCET